MSVLILLRERNVNHDIDMIFLFICSPFFSLLDDVTSTSELPNIDQDRGGQIMTIVLKEPFILI